MEQAVYLSFQIKKQECQMTPLMIFLLNLEMDREQHDTA